jgi:hypothetical protein
VDPRPPPPQSSAASARREKRAQAEFEDRVQTKVTRHINEYLLPFYKDRLETAEQLKRVQQSVLHARFLSMLQALHPDSTTFRTTRPITAIQLLHQLRRSV